MWWSKKQRKKNEKCMTFEPGNMSVEIGTCETVLDVALKHRVSIGHTCEGMGSCTTCRIFILEGNIDGRSEIEAERANERGFANNEKLACQTKPHPNLKVQIP